ncbi:T9SS type A sorting domain-containing protein, partial [candidate division WOR-3 bacterium]|nr:T9SS type A sorting domain-containing protein [candidate division WOR-3 bacterium]
WVAMQSDASPWPTCSIFVWDDNDGWKDGGLPDPSVEYISGPVTFDPGGTGAYWLYVSFTPVHMDTTSDFFICFWNALPPFILMDDTTTTWRSFCADNPNNDWQPVGYDYLIEAVMRYDYNGAEPKPAYIYAQKNATKDSVIVYWPPVTEDILDNPTAIDWYEIYSNTDPSYIPQSGDWLQSPSDTFMIEPLPGVNRNYLNYPVSVYLQVGAKSNMGYALYKPFNENAGATSDRNWVSLPWHSEYATASDLTDDLSPAGEALLKITNLKDDQTFESWIYHSVMGWYGTNFTIQPGRAYEMIAAKDSILVIVGSNDPDGVVTLNENAGSVGDRNWVSIPYNAAYTTVSDITTEYSTGGEGIVKITNLRDDQTFESWIYHSVMGWYGTDFALALGRGYEFVAAKDTVWDPTEYSNRSLEHILAIEQVQPRDDISVSVGWSIVPDRVPVWVIEPTRNALLRVRSQSVDYTEASVYSARDADSDSYIMYRDAGISHTVTAAFEMAEVVDIKFTAYRIDRAWDVITEQTIGSLVASKGDFHVISFDVGNFVRPWNSGEEVLLFVEVLTSSAYYFDAMVCRLDKGVDIQVIADLSLQPLQAAEVVNGSISWEHLDNEYVIGYSVYEEDRKMNERIVTTDAYEGTATTMIKPVLVGGYETSFGIQSRPTVTHPISYAFSMHPNPFTRRTAIDYVLPQRTQIDINVYNVTGQLVRTLVSDTQEPGYYTLFWEGQDNVGRQAAAGIYFVQMKAEGFEKQNKIILVK